MPTTQLSSTVKRLLTKSYDLHYDLFIHPVRCLSSSHHRLIHNWWPTETSSPSSRPEQVLLAPYVHNSLHEVFCICPR